MVLDIFVPGKLDSEQRELASRLDEALGPDGGRRDGRSRFFRRVRPALIRLAVRCRPELAERVLADLVQLAPGGVEEEAGDGWVEYAIYGAPGELPALPDLEAAVADGLVEVTSKEVPDDWADRWQDFHEPVLVGDRILVRPSWAEPQDGTIDLVVDPGQAFGTGAHPTTRMCLELLLELSERGEASGALADWGTGSGRARARCRQARVRAGRSPAISSAPLWRPRLRELARTAWSWSSCESTCAGSRHRWRRPSPRT